MSLFRLQSRRRLAFVSTAIVLLAAGCQQPRTVPAETPKVGGLDRNRAYLRLADIQPVPRFPEGQAVAATQPDEDAAKHLRAGCERFDKQLWTEAIASLGKAIEIDPYLIEARVLLARAAIRQGDNSLAESHLREALRHAPREVAVHQLLGEIAWQEGRPAQAIESLRLALFAGEETPDRPERVLAQLTLALALRKEGYPTAAVEQLEAYLDRTEHPTPQMNAYRELSDVIALYRGKAAGLIGEIQTEMGRHDLAAKAYERAVVRAPDDSSLKAQWARSLARAGQVDAALDTARKFIVNAPDDPTGLTLLKEICTLTNRMSRYDDELLRLAKSARSATLRMQLADQLLSRDRLDAASQILESVAADDSANAKARCLLGRLHLRRGDLAKGIDQLAGLLREQPSAYLETQAALDAAMQTGAKGEIVRLLGERAAARPVDAALRFLNGRVLLATGRADRSTAEFQAGAKSDPPFGPACAAMARMYFERKKWDETIEAADRAAKHGAKGADVHLLKGRALLALARFDDAETALLEAFRQNGKSAEPLFVLAEAAERRGDRKRAEQLYRRILDESNARHVPARERIIRLYLNAEKLKTAQEYFAEFEKLGLTGPQVDRCRAMLNLAASRNPSGMGRLEDYRAELTKIVEKYPKDAATRIDLAMTYLSVSDVAKALEQASAALEAEPDDLRARELKASLLTKQLEFDEAVKLVRGLLEDRPNDIAYQQRLIELAMNQADWSGAIQALRKLATRNDVKTLRDRVQRQLIETLLLGERFDEAIEAAKEWLAESPDDAARREGLLAALRGAKRFDDCVETSAKWLSADPINGELRAQYVEQLASAERIVEAQQKVLSWLAHDADDVGLHRILIALAWRAKDWDSAVELARTGAELPEQRVQFQNALGMTYRLAHRHDDAVAFYRARAKAAPSEATFRDWITTLLAAEQYEEAESVINSVLVPQAARRGGGGPFDPALVAQMRRFLANIYQLTDREPAALDQLEEVYKLAPLDPGINNDLGYTWADAGRNLDQAEKMIRLSLGERPRESMYLDSLGWVFYKRGRFKDAITYIDRAVRMGDAADPVLLDHLADAYYRDGRTEQAKQTWTKALELIDKQKESTDSVQNRKLRPKVAAKLKQLSDGTDVQVADLAPPPTGTRPAKDADLIGAR